MSTTERPPTVPEGYGPTAINAERLPFDGELTSIMATGKVVDWGYDDCINGNWYEWTEREEMPAWWPGEGKIWTDEGWESVPGYKWEWETGAHGCAGGAPPLDLWPLVDIGGPDRPKALPLDKIKPASARLFYLEDLRSRHGCPIGLRIPPPAPALIEIVAVQDAPF